MSKETAGDLIQGVGLTSLDISVNRAESRWHEVEDARIAALADRAGELERRGLDRAAAGELASAQWALSRARGLGAELRPRIDRCATRARILRCRCGVRPVWYRCGAWAACDRCRERRARRTSARITAGLEAALEGARENWRRAGCARDARPRVHLLTFTVRHEAAVDATLAKLERAWRAWYKRASAEGWVIAYASILEVTPGRDGRGHPHLHVAAVAPFLPFSAMREAWRRATGDRDAQLDAARKRRDGRPSTPRTAARYIAKYASKGVDLAGMTPNLAGRTLAMLWSRRTIRSSRAFWVTWTRPPCPCCGVLPDAEPLRIASRFRWEGPVALAIFKLKRDPACNSPGSVVRFTS